MPKSSLLKYNFIEKKLKDIFCGIMKRMAHQGLKSNFIS